MTSAKYVFGVFKRRGGDERDSDRSDLCMPQDRTDLAL